MAQKSWTTKMTGYVLEALGSLSATDLCNLSLPPHPHSPLRPKNQAQNFLKELRKITKQFVSR